MSSPKQDPSGEITVSTTSADIDGDGQADVVEEVVTTSIDIDGDGVADIVQQTTTTAIDIDGDGEADVIETITITVADLDGDGVISDDEILVEGSVEVREDLLEE